MNAFLEVLVLGWLCAGLTIYVENEKRLSLPCSSCQLPDLWATLSALVVSGSLAKLCLSAPSSAVQRPADG